MLLKPFETFPHPRMEVAPSLHRCHHSCDPPLTGRSSNHRRGAKLSLAGEFMEAVRDRETLSQTWEEGRGRRTYPACDRGRMNRSFLACVAEHCVSFARSGQDGRGLFAPGLCYWLGSNVQH
jgi:hypothetical protein